VLLRAIAISDDRLQAHPIGWRNGDGNSFAHHRPSHETKRSETLFGLFRQVPSTSSCTLTFASCTVCGATCVFAGPTTRNTPIIAALAQIILIFMFFSSAVA
jgi:hypothetical protein